jgi:hypothetical protein
MSRHIDWQEEINVSEDHAAYILWVSIWKADGRRFPRIFVFFYHTNNKYMVQTWRAESVK